MRVPGDKSISHRALILSAIADGSSEIHGILDSADVHATADALQALGVRIEESAERWIVHGVSKTGLRAPATSIDCGNSGTSARLLAGLIAGAGLPALLTGDASLSRRPMRRVVDPLVRMGADVRLTGDGTLPMELHGGRLREIEWVSDVASAQVKSAILLAALVGGVAVRISEPHPSRDHTERMLAARGVRVHREGDFVFLEPSGSLAAASMRVPADPSSAAFLAALAVAGGAGSEGLSLPDVCVSPTRAGFFHALERMGANITWHHGSGWDEPVATLDLVPSTLRGITVDGAEVPAMVDELPMLACLASIADGETVITGAAELRVKESDRIGAVVAGLREIGVDAQELPDGLRVQGAGGRRLAGQVVTHGDHRLAMAFGVLGALPGNDVRVDDPDCVSVSYPTFWRDLARVQR